MRRGKRVQLARQLHEQYRTKEADWLRNACDVSQLSCKIDCAYCCYQLTMGNLVSAVLIADHLLREGRNEELQQLREQGNAQQLALVKYGPVEGPLRYFQDSYQPCVLLKDNRCSVYDLRPAACSSYYVASDPELCKRASAATIVEGLDAFGIMFEAVKNDSEFLSRVLGQEFAQSMMMAPLGVMVTAAVALLDGDDATFRSYCVAQETGIGYHKRGNI